MRGAVLALLCMSSLAVAGGAPDPTAVRPDVKAIRSTEWTPKNGKLVKTGENVWTYNADGRVVRMEKREGGKVTVSSELTYDTGGRVLSSTYRDKTGRKEVRQYTYKLDANGRIAESTLRDPSKPAGELIRYEYQWGADGSHTEQAFRHYAQGGPYRSDQKIFDAKERLTRNCYEHGGCSMIEYNAHGDIDRIRQQNKERHDYLVYENTYDKAGHLVVQILGGTQSEYTYDARGEMTEQLTRRIAAQGGAVDSKVVYTYDYR